MTTIAFRVDGGAEIGLGHAYRCLALAEALGHRGAGVLFVTAALPPAFIVSLQQRGFRVETIGGGARDEIADARATSTVLAHHGPIAYLVVDHYGLGLAWEQNVERAAARLAVIDDNATRAHDCDLLIDHNVSAHPAQYDGLLPARTIRLIGPRYALLRASFARKTQGDVAPRSTLRRLHVAFGGTDPTRETEKVLHALTLPELAATAADIVVGSANPRLAELRAQVALLPNAQLHIDAEDMASLLQRADLAIGAAGVSALERCACGLPALLVVVADNQAPIAKELAVRGAALPLGASGSVTAEQIARAVAALAACPEWLAQLSQTAAALCDGRGAGRVARTLLGATVQLRAATTADSTRIYAWRNHEITRRYSMNNEVIDQATHERWFARRMADTQSALLIAEDVRGPVGVLRYDVEGETAAVSIYLVPDRHGEGWGAPILRAGDAWLRRQRPQVRVIDADVLPDNIASQRAFEEAGYRLHALRLTRALTNVSAETD